MTWLGLDIGGANIKAASTDGYARSIPFRFWNQYDKLETTLTAIIKDCPATTQVKVAATMTAELADCFESRKDGVGRIVDHLVNVCATLELPAPIFAGTDVAFREASDAKEQWLITAASNWAMLAAYASRFLTDSTGLVVDMGSTTTDIIPVRNGAVVSRGKTDSHRLHARELVYVGVDRTPVCSIVTELILDGRDTPIAREFFATVGDAMLVSGLCEEDPSDRDTADGRPKTIENSAKRICRMVCEDFDDVGIRQAKLLSYQVLERAGDLISEAIEYRIREPENVVVAGCGSGFLRTFTKLSRIEYVKPLAVLIGETVNDVATAYAVAVLASEAE